MAAPTSTRNGTNEITEPVLPLVPEQVTKEWLSKVLGLKITSAEMTDAIHGTASKLFFSITYDTSETAEKPDTICIKGGFSPTLTDAIPVLIEIYRREAMFFDVIAPKLPSMHLVRSWWAGQTPKQGLVIMEDLRKKDYTFGVSLKPWSVDLVKQALTQLAMLHGTTWGQGPKDYPWLTPHYDDTMRKMLPAVNYSQFVVSEGRPELPEALRDQDRVLAMLEKHFGSRNPKFRCLLHGDCHIMNASISPEGAVGLVDWQMLDSGTCFHDVGYFFNGALTIEDRRKHETELLEHYLEELHKYGGPKFSHRDEDVMIEFRKSLISGIGWFVATSQMQPIEIIAPMIHRYVAAMEDHNVVELLESL